MSVDDSPLAILIATVGSGIAYQPLFRYPPRHFDSEMNTRERGSRMNSQSDFDEFQNKKCVGQRT